MNEQDIRNIVQDEIAKAAQKAQYGVTRVPVHIHNNIDAPNIPQYSITGFVPLPGIDNSIASPTLLNGQALVFGDTAFSTPYINYANIFTYPLPIIYGYGTTSSLTLTGTPISGATSATLTGAWGGVTGNYGIQFNSTEVRIAILTNGSTAITWSPGLSTGAGSSTITLIGNARFKGGNAPYGTVIIFRNDDDGILQLWVRSQPGIITEAWAGVDLGGTGLFVYN